MSGGAMRELLAELDVRVTGLEKLGKANKEIEGTGSKLAKFGKLVAGGLIAEKVREWSGELIELGSNLQDTSAQLGIDSDDLQAWQFAAKLNGVQASELAASFKILQKNAADAAKGGAESGGAFQGLGVALRDAKGNMRATTDILYDTGLAIAKLPSESERTQKSLEIFGRAGAKLGPLFSQGEKGLQQALDEINRLGGGLSKRAINALDDLGDQTDRWKMALTSVEGEIAAAVLPTMTRWLTSLTQTTVAFFHTNEGAQILKSTMVALGVVGAGIALSFAAEWAPAIGGFALLVLIIDDVKTALEGGDSVIKRMIDSLFGVGAGAKFFKQLKDDAKDFSSTLKEIVNGLQAVKKGIQDLRSGKLVNDVKEQVKKDNDEYNQRKSNAAGLTVKEDAQLKARRPDDYEQRKKEIEKAKQILSDKEREASGGVYRLPQFIPTEEAEQLVDKMHAIKTTVGGGIGKGGLDNLTRYVQSISNAPGQGPPAAQGPKIGSQQVQLNQSNVYQITAGSGDETKNAVRDANDESAHAAINALAGSVSASASGSL